MFPYYLFRRPNFQLALGENSSSFRGDVFLGDCVEGLLLGHGNLLLQGFPDGENRNTGFRARVSGTTEVFQGSISLSVIEGLEII